MQSFSRLVVSQTRQQLSLLGCSSSLAAAAVGTTSSSATAAAAALAGGSSASSCMRQLSLALTSSLRALGGVRCFGTEEGYTRLYVGNLPYEATEDDVVQLCKEFGDVQNCHMPMISGGRRRGYAFVDMKSDAAEAAIAQLADRDFMGRPVAISHAQPRASDAAGGSDSGSSGGGGRRGSSSGSRYGDGGGGRSGARGSWGGSRRDDAGSAAADVPAPRPGCKRLYVGGLNYRCTAQQLAEHLGMCGRVEDVVIPLDEDGRSRGYAFVELEESAADKALSTLDQGLFQGRTMWVRPAHGVDEARSLRSNRRGARGGGRDRGGWEQRGEGGGGGGIDRGEEQY